MLVAVLLATAAGVLHSGGPPERPVADASPAAVPATPGVAGTAAPGAGSGGGSEPGAVPPEWVLEGRVPAPQERVPVPEGMVGVPVALPEPGALAMLRPGDRVDLLTVPAAGGAPDAVAREVTVLAVDPGSATVLLALPPERAATALSAATGDRFALVVRP